jgi:DivIVA domain-containing protein
MSSDLDLPLLPSAEQIRRREFATVRRGYDPDQVRDYLTAVATQVETLEKDLRELRLDKGNDLPPSPAPAAGKAEPEADPYEELGKRFAHLMENADAEAKKILDDAHARASKMLEEARTEADRMKVDAQSRAEEARQAGNEALDKAKMEAQRMLTGLAARRENLVTQLQQMQAKLLTVAQDLEVTIEEPLDAETSELIGEPPKQKASKKVPPKPAPDVVDPRYDDLWVSSGAVDLPELASIELDFDEEDPEKPE